MRDKQIFVRVSQETYDWVSIQADAVGISRGAAVAAVLDVHARCGAVLERTTTRLVLPPDGGSDPFEEHGFGRNASGSGDQ